MVNKLLKRLKILYFKGFYLIPYSYGKVSLNPRPTVSLPFPALISLLVFSGAVDGKTLENSVKVYLDKGDDVFDWPCWELNDHDAISGQGDFGN